MFVGNLNVFCALCRLLLSSALDLMPNCADLVVPGGYTQKWEGIE